MLVSKSRRRVRFAVASALLAGLLPSMALAQEGLFGFFQGLGRPFEEPPRYAPPTYGPPAYDEPAFGPLQLRVRPHRQAVRRSRPSVVSREKGNDTIVAQKEAYARLDPARNPQWYLSDPTLRRGDLVVTASGITVFTGRTEALHQAADFRPLAEASWGSKSERQTLARMAQVAE